PGPIAAILPDPVGGAPGAYEAVAATIQERIRGDLVAMAAMSGQELLDGRLKKFLAMGIFNEKKQDD
ncbi:acetyl-CoA carboxylase carboxyl transferase subunit alpha, partial [bacterium]|nr:acetyl-CoA carboxylase carboxyl transferase subunit alpha [bacterium]